MNPLRIKFGMLFIVQMRVGVFIRLFILSLKISRTLGCAGIAYNIE